MRSGVTHIASLEISDRRVRFTEDALVTSQAEVSGKSAQGDFSGTIVTPASMCAMHRKWKVVSFEPAGARTRRAQVGAGEQNLRHKTKSPTIDRCRVAEVETIARGVNLRVRGDRL